MVKLYTDGSCLKNPGGPGGWAVYIIQEDGNEFYLSDGEVSTTNNRMELQAVLEALSCVKENSDCIIYTDSKLTINCATGEWKRKANLDLWKEYDQLSKNKKIQFEWVKGHSGDEYNDKVDKLAYEEAKKQEEISKIFTKVINYTDCVTKDKVLLEIELQNIASSYNFSPKIYNTKFEKNKCVINMEDLGEMCIADKYGENPQDIPETFWDQIREILNTLYSIGIEYVDITPYNFIEKNEKIYIIDFGHAYYSPKKNRIDSFLYKVLEGHNAWNPIFK